MLPDFSITAALFMLEFEWVPYLDKWIGRILNDPILNQKTEYQSDETLLTETVPSFSSETNAQTGIPVSVDDTWTDTPLTFTANITSTITICALDKDDLDELYKTLYYRGNGNKISKEWALFLDDYVEKNHGKFYKTFYGSRSVNFENWRGPACCR